MRLCSTDKLSNETAQRNKAKDKCLHQYFTIELQPIIFIKLKHLGFFRPRMRAGKNLHYYERVLEKTGQREMINLQLCGHLCCCANCEKVRWSIQFKSFMQGVWMFLVFILNVEIYVKSFK